MNWYKLLKFSVRPVQSPLYKQLFALRSEMAAAAQKIYNEWIVDPNDDLDSGGGICDEVAMAISGVISSNVPDVEITDGGHDGDDHAYPIAYNETEAYAVDISPHVYEQGGGFQWKKIEGITIDASDVNIYQIDRDNL